MRILKFVFLFLVYSILNASADQTQSIANKLNMLRESYAKSGEKGGDNLRLTADIQKAIQIYVRGADTNDWASPSTERLKRISQIGAVLEPHLSLLIDLGTPTAAGDANSNAFNILSFAHPTSEFRNQLLELTNIPKPRGAARAAYDIIFNLGMDTPDIRKGIIKKMADYQPESYRNSTANEIFYAAGASWRIEEAVPLYIALLQSEYRNKDQLNARVRAVANAARGLGPKAADILPLLQQQIARMKLENADFQDINVIEGAIRAIEGKDPIEPLLAVSGAGPLDANPLPQSSVPPTATTVKSTPAQAAVTPDHQAKSTATPSPKFEAKTPSSSNFPIVPVAILAAVILGSALYLLRRNSK